MKQKQKVIISFLTVYLTGQGPNNSLNRKVPPDHQLYL